MSKTNPTPSFQTETAVVASNPTTVAIAFDFDLHRAMEIFRGINRYNQNHDSWRLIPLNYDFENILAGLLAHGEIEGLIGSFVSDRWIKTFDAINIPVVNVSGLSLITRVSTVGVDDQAVGRLAADAFLERNLKNFGFFGKKAVFESTERGLGFQKRIEGSGSQLIRINVAYDGRWKQEIKDLKTPSGLFCTDDFVARCVIEESHHQGFRIPQDFSIIGAGNSPLDTLFSHTPLASIELPFEAIGYTAAEVLSNAMTSLSRAPLRRKLPPGKLFKRESLVASTELDRILEEIIQEIQMRLAEPLEVGKLAKKAGLSRRSLEIRFQKKLHTSPYAYIQDRRRELAETLLKETDWMVGRIAERCGFTEQHHFSSAFRRWTGKSPTEYRVDGE